MFKIVEKHPFMSGFILGFFGVGVVGRGIRKLFKGRITIIQVSLDDLTPEDITEEKNSASDGKEHPAKGN